MVAGDNCPGKTTDFLVVSTSINFELYIHIITLYMYMCIYQILVVGKDKGWFWFKVLWSKTRTCME